MREFPSDVAFTPAVKAVQQRKGSRGSYARIEKGRGWRTTITPDLADFLADLDMFYLGTATADGQPYIQVPRRPARVPQGDRRPHPRVRRLRPPPATPRLATATRRQSLITVFWRIRS